MAIKPEKPVPTVNEMKRKAYERKQKAIEKARAEREKARRIAANRPKAPTMRDNAKDVVNRASDKAKAEALKDANKPTNKTGSTMNKQERAAYNKLNSAEQTKMLKNIQDAQRAGAKTTRNTTKPGGMKKVPNMGGRGRMRMSGSGGGLRLDDMNR